MSTVTIECPDCHKEHAFHWHSGERLRVVWQCPCGHAFAFMLCRTAYHTAQVWPQISGGLKNG